MTAALGAVRRHASLWWLLGASSLVLLFTYSRSAWLGAIVALALLVWYFLPNSLRKMALLLAVVAVLAGAGGISQLRHNDTVQNTVFHSDENSAAYVSSNAARSSAMTEGLREVWQQPFGRGPGTAGPASYRNFSAPRIAENYYIQLAQEVGVVGLALFVAINLLLVNELWRRRRDPLALVLLASLVGITLVNMLSHAWADDTLAVLWWGLAGVAMSLPASKNAILKRPNR
jgi:O-antigen ligase